METRRIVVSGQVQGVGYRDGLQAEARRLGVTGWVRNRNDGTVEAIVQGPQAAVQQLIEWARRGPPLARVAALSVVAAGAEGSRRFSSMERRPTA